MSTISVIIFHQNICKKWLTNQYCCHETVFLGFFIKPHKIPCPMVKICENWRRMWKNIDTRNIQGKLRKGMTFVHMNCSVILIDTLYCIYLWILWRKVEMQVKLFRFFKTCNRTHLSMFEMLIIITAVLSHYLQW